MPQLENGYTRIANEILEKVYRMKLSGSKLRIILVVWRYTYGFNRKSTDLAISFIAEATGVHKQQVKSELKELIEMELLTVTKFPTFNSSRELSFNKNFKYEEVKIVTGSKVSTPTGSKNTTTTGSKSTTQERQPKENTKDSVQKNIDLFEYWNSKAPHKHKDVTNDISKQLNLLTVNAVEVVKLSIDRYCLAYNDKKHYYDHKWTLDKFIKQANGYKSWTDDGSLWVDYTPSNIVKKTKSDVIKINRNAPIRGQA